MRKEQDDVRQFMSLGGQHVGDMTDPTLLEERNATREEIEALHVAATVEHQYAVMLGKFQGLAMLSARLLVEETAEITDALSVGDVDGVADGLGDLIYIALGVAVRFGIDLGPVFDSIHVANMQKFPVCEQCGGAGWVEVPDSPLKEHERVCTPCGGKGRLVIRDEGGKIMKPEGWTPPDIAAVLARQQVPRGA